MTEFTATQGRYLAFIHAYIDGFGLPPAESEIAKAIGVAPPSVNQMMKTLEKKNLIRRQPGVPRSIEILVSSEVIPKWKGKRITRTVKVWMLDEPAQSGNGPSGGNASIYRLKITLRNSAPPIWRRIETRDVTPKQLHELIQTAMGWTNSHLHQFEVGDVRYTDPRFLIDDFGAVDYSGIAVSNLIAEHGSKLRFSYEYDFGDGWEHDLVLEEMIEAEPGKRYPRCIDGERACPPEDVGGIYGFADYVKAITNPNDDEYEELIEWNGPFDPDKFSAAVATRRMKKGLPSW